MRKLAIICTAFALALAAEAASLDVAAAAPGAPGAGEKAVLAALDAWKDAMVKKDRAALEKIFHPELSYGHSSAMVETKEQAIPHIMNSGGWADITFADTTIRLKGNLALVNGKTDMHQRGKDKITISKLTVLTVWIKGAQGWQMIGRQAVRRPDDDQVIAAKAALAAVSGAKPAAAVPAPAAAAPK